jgi:hypothetical protein
MNFKMIFRIQSWILLVEAVMMLPPLLISMVMRDSPASGPLSLPLFWRQESVFWADS